MLSTDFPEGASRTPSESAASLYGLAKEVIKFADIRLSVVCLFVRGGVHIVVPRGRRICIFKATSPGIAAFGRGGGRLARVIVHRAVNTRQPMPGVMKIRDYQAKKNLDRPLFLWH